MISPAGRVVWTYEKTDPVLGLESGFTARGRGVLPVADTPYGRLTTVICNDVGDPGLLRQAGRNGADILLVPTHETITFEASANAAQVVYRAIENGTSLIRPSGGDISLMTDYQGRVIASQNYSASNDGILLASVPTHGVSTIYSHIGDVFAYLCTIGLLLGIHLARRSEAQLRLVSSPRPPGQRRHADPSTASPPSNAACHPALRTLARRQLMRGTAATRPRRSGTRPAE